MSDSGRAPLPWNIPAPVHLGPPVYTKRPPSCGPAGIFEIALQPDKSSFQEGYLGLDEFQTWIVGDVLTKLDTNTSSTMYFTKCTVSLRATERVQGAQSQEMELYAACHTLWEAHSIPTHVPAALSFQFPLTSDLPQCIHGHASSLTYMLEAQLHNVHGYHLVAQTMLHPTRYTPAAPQALAQFASPGFEACSTHQWNAVTPNARYSLSPLYWIHDSGVPIHLWLDRSVIRNTEPAVVQVHIPPPDQGIVLEQGLTLRSVEAELVRVTQSHPAGKMLDDAQVLEHTLELQRARMRSHMRPESSASAPPAPHPHVRVALVAYSGKSCRFHSQRPVHLRFALQVTAPFAQLPAASFDGNTTQHDLGGDGRCESITQDTPLHNVRFVLCIRVLVHNSSYEQLDWCTGQLLKVVPGSAGSEAPPSSHPLPHARGSQPSSGSTAKQGNALCAGNDVTSWFVDTSEYDGYDDASAADGSMRAMTISGISSHSDDYTATIIRDPAGVEFARTETLDPPPSMRDHMNDTRLPDDLRSNPSYATQLANLPTTTEEPGALYEPIIDLDADAAPSDELPNFDQASQQSNTTLLGFEVSMDGSEPPAWEPTTENDVSPGRSDALPPSYDDSASNNESTRTFAEDSCPPAYDTNGAHSSLASLQPSMTSSSDRPTVLPPVYEA